MENSIDQFIREYLEWYKPIVKDINVFLSIPNEYSKLPNLKENAIYLNLFEKVNQKIDAKKYMVELLSIADVNNINLYLEPIPRHKYITNKAKKTKITKEYLIKYYENFGFKMTDWDWMERIYINKN
jgi:hypothetical protein